MTDFISKYWPIIAEEVNVKEIKVLDSTAITYKKIYKPIGVKLKSFGSDAGKIIAAGKDGRVEDLGDGRLLVDQQWTLESDQYELQYDGIDTTTVNIDGDMIVRLDVQIDWDLQQEWLIREVCRLLNQMRKDADYQINQRVACVISCDDQGILDMVARYESDMAWEALLDRIEYMMTQTKLWDISSSLQYQDQTIYFSLSIS